MSARPAGPRRPRAGLSDEDRELWRRVAESVRPLRDGASLPALEAGVESVEGRRPGLEPGLLPQPPIEASEARRTASFHGPPAPPPAPRVLRPQGRPEPPIRWSEPSDDRPRTAARIVPGLDRATARRLARGRVTPDARLDLHGMTADRAHGALLRFVSESWSFGRRCVLVVTGKGRDEEGARGEGVLRRETPRWLEVPPLRDMVVGVFEAHPRHGGGGALYIYIKRRR